MDKVSRATSSAKLLLDARDVDGACNSAYYAMFDAAGAALIWSGAPVDATGAKTHSGLISAFSLRVVKTGLLPVELGRTLNRAAEIRLVADYTGDEVTLDNARWAVEQAMAFVDAVRRRLESPRTDPADGAV
ncbi:MAG: HEPN domain-containing protein [Thermoleophilia bacterium]|nr:HEPN domain-containing protein [Thermoleophilia bacterium]